MTRKYLLAAVVTVGSVAVLVGGCSPATVAPAVTSTDTPIQTATALPTDVPTSMPTPAPTSTSAPTPTPTPPSGEWIVFASTLGDDDGDDTSETDIYATRSDGSETTRLTDHPDSDWDPDLSPDGRQVVFVSNRDSSSDIYVINVDGTGLTRLTKDKTDDGAPAWSPDGRRIAFVSSRDGGSEIYTMKADGSGVARLTNNESDDRDPAWSPDGQQVAYTSFRKGSGFDIFLMNADGGNPRQLTKSADFEVAPAWSPDGEHIAYSCWHTADLEKDKSFNIFTLTNSQAIALLYGGETPRFEKLASGIHIVGIDGTGLQQLTEDEGGEGEFGSWSPAWSPDGRQIVFASDRDGDADIYRMNADGSNVTSLTDNSEGDYTPSW